MSYGGLCRNCRNPHKRLRINTSGRALNGSHRSCFTDKKQYERLPFTERQELIISGGTPETPVMKQHIVVIMRKAESLGRYDIAEKVYEMYGYFFHEVYPGDPAPETAKAILDGLTPESLKK